MLQRLHTTSLCTNKRGLFYGAHFNTGIQQAAAYTHCYTGEFHPYNIITSV